MFFAFISRSHWRRFPGPLFPVALSGKLLCELPIKAKVDPACAYVFENVTLFIKTCDALRENLGQLVNSPRKSPFSLMASSIGPLWVLFGSSLGPQLVLNWSSMLPR